MSRGAEALNIKYPIIQAPMSWITNAEFVAAVSNAGGLGTLGPNAGQRIPTPDPEETAERMRKEIQKTRMLTDKPFAVNLLMIPGDPFTDALKKVLLEEKISHVVAVGPAPDFETFEAFKNVGTKVIFRDGIPQLKDIIAADKSGLVDVLIATGIGEGGGMPFEPVGTMSMVLRIVDAVSVPVFAAGGIVDRRTVNAVFALGAEGVYCGTRFILSKECPAADNVKEDIINTKAEDLIIFKSGDGQSFRATPHKFAKDALAVQDGEARPAVGVGGFRAGMLEGKLEEGIVSVDDAIDVIKSVDTCKDIIEDLMGDVK